MQHLPKGELSLRSYMFEQMLAKSKLEFVCSMSTRTISSKQSTSSLCVTYNIPSASLKNPVWLNQTKLNQTIKLYKMQWLKGSE